MTRTCLMLCFGLSCLGASGAGAGEAPALAPGDRVRVEARGLERPVVGQLLMFDSDRLRLIPQDGSDSTVVNRPDITALARSAGRHSRGHGAAIGAGIGVVAGVVIGAASGDDEASDLVPSFTAGEKALILGGTLGLLGALIGLIPNPGERWEKIPLDAGPVRAAHVDDPGARIGLALRF
jgi:hypothetical protein